MWRTTSASLLVGGVLALAVSGCGGSSTPSANGERAASTSSTGGTAHAKVTVTAAEAAAFGAKAQAAVPSLTTTLGKDFRTLDQAVCSSFAAGQRYEDVSNTVALTASLPLDSPDVDTIISAAVTTSCPELLGTRLGDGSKLELKSR